MTLEGRAVDLCLALGLDKATLIENKFLGLYCNKYFNDFYKGTMTTQEYMHGADIRLERYIPLYLCHYSLNNIPSME